MRGLRLLDAEVGVRSVSNLLSDARSRRPKDPPFVNGVIEAGDALGPFRERAFVAIPLLELELVLPDSGRPLRSIVDLLPPYPMEPIRDLTRRLRAEVAHGP